MDSVNHLRFLQSSVLSDFCENFIDPDPYHQQLNIGYSHSAVPFILIPSLALALNLFIIFSHLRRYFKER
jgi:hypothetical protein